VKARDILIAVGIIAVALAITSRSDTAAPYDIGTDGATTSRTPYPCESDRSVQCTWQQYRQIAEEDCARERSKGGECEIVTNGHPPRAVRIPSDGEISDMRRRIDEDKRRLCDDFTNAAEECPASRN
jgi:hypothetical protein